MGLISCNLRVLFFKKKYTAFLVRRVESFYIRLALFIHVYYEEIGMKISYLQRQIHSTLSYVIEVVIVGERKGLYRRRTDSGTAHI